MALRYKSFNSLMATVEEDLSKFADNNLIRRRRYIKTAKKCNATLGIKLNKIKQYVVSIENGKGDLPPDFYRGISAFLICQQSLGWLYAPTLGTLTQEYTKEEIINTGLPFEDYGCINSCGTGCFYVTRKYNDKELIYKDIQPVTISENSVPFFSQNSPNLDWYSQYQIDLDSNQITANFPEGQLYLSYICDMIDEKGNLLVLDHDLTNDYYEWAIKEAVLTDIVYNGDADAVNLLKDARMITPIKRNEAMSIVLMPEYQKLNDYTKKLESDFYYQQVAMFT